MSEKIVIIGAGGFAREIVDVIDACNKQNMSFEPLGFVVDEKYGSAGTIINDLPILGGFEWLENHSSQVRVICSVGAPNLRYQLAKRAFKLGCRFCTVVHPTAILTRWITLGDGVVITAGCILTNQIIIGNHVHINLDSTIGHDVIIEDFVSLAPGVHISGNVLLKQGCYIGTGANVIEKLRIGEWSIVGAGSTIVRDVDPNTTVVGVPGKVIKTKDAGWHEYFEV